MESIEGRRLHGEAAQAREDGRFLDSWSANDRAIMAYAADQDLLGMAEAIACRAITYRVYANLKENEVERRSLLTIAKNDMIGSVEIAHQSGDPTALALPLYTLAQVREDLGELPEAVETYGQAVDAMKQHPPKGHDRPSVLANIKVHQATCEYKAGDKEALSRAEQSLKELEDAEEPSQFAHDVWVSGGYMRIAEALRADYPTLARENLKKAKEVIDSNPELTNRQQQWEKLAATFSD